MVVAGIFLGGIGAMWSLSAETVSFSSDCDSVWHEYVVRGDSMRPLLVHNEVIRVDLNYYHCHQPRVGEVVVLLHPHREAPLVKVVYAVEGDTLHFTPTEQSGIYHLQINNTSAEASGEPFVLTAADRKKIQAYIDAYAGVVPADYMLILGLNQGRSLDSTEYGLYHYASLVGKVDIAL